MFWAWVNLSDIPCPKTSFVLRKDPLLGGPCPQQVVTQLGATWFPEIGHYCLLLPTVRMAGAHSLTHTVDILNDISYMMAHLLQILQCFQQCTVLSMPVVTNPTLVLERGFANQANYWSPIPFIEEFKIAWENTVVNTCFPGPGLVPTRVPCDNKQ